MTGRVAVLVALVLAVALPAAALPAAPSVLVLGDSYASGEGLPTAERVAVDVPAGDVVVDAELVARIVRELVDNALRHTVEEVEVVARVGAEDVVVDVVDHGPGLDDDLADTFARGGHDLHRTTRGLGLGLTLVVETAAALGGDVVFEDTDDGSRVSVRVPHGAAVRTDRVAATVDAAASPETG